MTHPGLELFVSKAAGVRSPAAPSDTLPDPLLEAGVRRLRLVTLVMMGIWLVSWLGVVLVSGDWQGEFSQPSQWGPGSLVMAASAVMFFLVERAVLPPRRLITLGLVYQVVVSFGMAATEYLHAFVGVESEMMTADRIGSTGVVIWMLAYAALVPARPRHALYALLGSAAATPIVYGSQMAAGLAPALTASAFFRIMVFRYLIAVVLAYLTTRIIYRLGQDVRRARRMGSYQLESLIGRGGMGEVWRASHRMLARPAAVKLIHPDALGGGDEATAAAVARFQREAQVTATLRSPHTVELFDFGRTDDGTLYYVMELLNGIDLQTLVQRHGPQPAERVVHILRQASGSLAEAHHHGLVHRDIKPANIQLCRQGIEYDVVKVLDFGLVKRHTELDVRDVPALTVEGTIAGTPSFMAPELAAGRGSIDGRADLYCLACVAYWLLTGQLVFQESTMVAMVVAHAKEQPVPPSRRTEVPVPAALEELILTCLAKSPADRLPSAVAFGDALQRIRLDRAWTAERAAAWWQANMPASPTYT